MKKISKALTVLLAILMVFTSSTVLAFADVKKNESIDVVFVIDDTKSMKTNDPKKLTATAVSKYLDRIDTDNYKCKVGIVTFSQKVMKTMKLTDLNDKSKKTIKDFATKKFNQNGSCTNCAVGIEAAVNMLNSSSKDAAKGIILVTDGEYDFDGTKAQKDKQVSKAEKLLDEQINEAKENEIRIFTIKIKGKDKTENSGKVDFKKITDTTEGKKYESNTAKQVDSNILDIQRLIYGWIVREDTIDVKEGVPFTYDFDFPAGVVYANIQITHIGDLTINSFKTKDGKDIYYESKDEDGYTNIRAAAPPEGEATLTGVSNKTQIMGISYIIAYDLEMELTVDKTTVTTKESIDAQVILYSGDKEFTDLGYAASLFVNAKDEDGNFESTLVTYDEDSKKYSADIKITTPGTYTLSAKMCDSNGDPIRNTDPKEDITVIVNPAPFPIIPVIIAILAAIILAVVLFIVLKKLKDKNTVKPFGMFQYDYYNLTTGRNDSLYTWRLDGMDDPKTHEVSVFKLMNMEPELSELEGVVFIGAGDKKAPKLQVVNRTPNWQVRVNALTVTTNPVDVMRDTVVEIRSDDNTIVITATRL